MILIDYIRAASDTGVFEYLDYNLREEDESDRLWVACGLKDGKQAKYYANTPEEALIDLINDLK